MPDRPELHHKASGVTLSGAALIDLLSAVHEKGADFRFKATGRSMHPTIRDGDILTLSPLNGLRPASNDVVAFHHPDTGNLVVHRIIGIASVTFEGRGDNSEESDGQIPISNIVGLVTRLERNGIPIFWPDSRRSPFLARVYFTLSYLLLRLKKRFYAVCTKIIRYWKKWKRRIIW
jgi:signal peptidase I